MTAAEDQCRVKWCDEAGDHDVHRRYLMSIALAGGRLVFGVNVVESSSGQEVELTTVPRHGRPAVIGLRSGEATAIAESLVEAASRTGSD
jgi:hypothetical protein